MDKKKLDRIAEGLQKILKVVEKLHSTSEKKYEFDLDMAVFNITLCIRNFERLKKKMDEDDKKFLDNNE